MTENCIRFRRFVAWPRGVVVFSHAIDPVNRTLPDENVSSLFA